MRLLPSSIGSLILIFSGTAIALLCAFLLVLTASFKAFSTLLTISNLESTLFIRSMDPTVVFPIVRTTCPFTSFLFAVCRDGRKARVFISKTNNGAKSVQRERKDGK